MTRHHSINKQNKPSFKPGFTLIELSLVIAVVAVLMLLGVHFYKQQQEAFRVKQTALDMQQIAQAAQTYYVNDINNYWPTSINQLNGAKSCGPLLLNNGGSCAGTNSYQLSFPSGYTAQGPANTKNPPVQPEPPCPGGHMCWEPTPEPQTYKASVITVSTTAPNATTAKQLAALLPMSKIAGNTVSMNMPAPNESFKDISLSLPELWDMMNQEGVIMVKSISTVLVGQQTLMGNKDVDDKLKTDTNRVQVNLPACPPGWYPGYDTALVQTIANIKTSAVGSRGVYICHAKQDFYPNETTPTYFVVKTDRRTVGDYFSAVALVVSYCIPPKVAACNSSDDPSCINMKDKFTGYTPIKPQDLPKADSCHFANFTSGTG